MKDQNQFKSELQKAAYQEEVTPPASVWQKLSTSIPPKGKRSTSPWRLALLLLFLFVVMTAVILRLTEPKSVGAFVLHAENVHDSISESQAIEDPQSKALVNKIKADKPVETSAVVEEKEGDKPKKTINTNTSAIASETDNPISASPIAFNTQEEKTTTNNQNQANDHTLPSQFADDAVVTRDETKAEPISVSNDPENSLAAAPINKEISDSSQPDPPFETATILSPLPLWLFMPLQSQKKGYEIVTLPLNNQSVLKTSKWRMYTDAYIGGGWAARSMSAEDPEMVSYLNLRDGSEQDLSWFESGIRVGMAVRRWRFDLGLQYGQINAYMQYTYLGHRQMVAMEVIDAMGLPRIDTVLRFGTRERIVQNTYRDISIPLRVGYQFYQGGVGITAYVGVNPVFGLQPQGVILRTDETDYNLQADPEEWFNRQMRWYGTAQIQLSVPMNNRASFLLDMGIIHDFNGINTDSNPIDQSYNMLRGSAGVRYFFESQATKGAF